MAVLARCWPPPPAMQLLARGRTYQQVADELGYANRGTVHRIVQQALETHEADNVEFFR